MKAAGAGAAGARLGAGADPAASDLAGFRAAQQLAYGCAEAVAATLDAGVTEREAAAAMRGWLHDRGVEEWFHLPFAWFGDRTALRQIRLPHQFFPTDRALVPGMPYILDCAPVVEGYTADIGFTASLGPNTALEQLLADLAEHRALILASVNAGATRGEVYRAVDELAARQGNQNRHQAYPFAVLAHRVDHQPAPSRVRDRVPVRGGTAFGFGIAATMALGRTRAGLWNGGWSSRRPPRPGLWAIEPHLGRGDVGAKFEELLVVTAGGARWLDDDLPHVRRWAQKATP